jgi:hypothetical protein
MKSFSLKFMPTNSESDQHELSEHIQSSKSEPSGLLESESSSERPHWYICLSTFLLSLAQTVHCALFITLYPVLFGLRGFSEDDLTFLELGSIPWCLKFIVGYLFDSIWRPPRFVVAILQLIISGITIGLASVPVEEVETTAYIYYGYSAVVICHDVCFDGQMVHQFGNWGALLSLFQQFGYYFMDTVLCFVAASNFSQSMFLGWNSVYLCNSFASGA